ncbi:MAG TPA: FmdB family zinc ribbon protein [Vicinamibacterales bacterium]|nr:FmdB family zinc ribbon protein [Vicinamibacterales bacterium]
MPLYEYQCDACGHRFEVIQKYADPPVDTCPKCAGSVHKLFSSPAIQFKGSGWYITDYARAGKSDGAAGNEKADKAQKADGGAESKSESKTDTTSETKSEPKPAPPSTSS